MPYFKLDGCKGKYLGGHYTVIVEEYMSKKDSLHSIGNHIHFHVLVNICEGSEVFRIIIKKQ
jgi:hypothetical protein